MKVKPDYCHLCFRVLAPYDPDRSDDGKYHVSCMNRYMAHRLRVMYLMGLFLLLALPLSAANQLPPALECKIERGEAVCEMRHYFGTWRPKWEVYIGETLVAKDEGYIFRPVTDGDWRIVRASIPAKEGKVVFEVWVREVDGKPGYFTPERSAYFVPYKPPTPTGEQVAARQ